MGREDGRVLVAQLAGHGLAIAFDLVAGGARWPRPAAPVRLRPRRARRTAEGCEIPRCPSPALRRRPRRAKRQSLVVFACETTGAVRLPRSLRALDLASAGCSGVCAARFSRHAVKQARRRARTWFERCMRAPCGATTLTPVGSAKARSAGVRLRKVERQGAVCGQLVSSTLPFSSKLRATSSARASSAASASGPVASICNWQPSTAASVRMARILLPSTRSPSLITSIFDWYWLANLTNRSAGPRVQALRVGDHDHSCQCAFAHIQAARPWLPPVHRVALFGWRTLRPFSTTTIRSTA